MQKRVKRLSMPVIISVMMLLFTGCVSPEKQGDKAALQKHWDDAVAYYREASQKHPQNLLLASKVENAVTNATQWHESQGDSYAAAGEWDKAIASFERSSKHKDSELIQAKLEHATTEKRKQESQELLTKATDCLRNGDIDAAMRLLDLSRQSWANNPDIDTVLKDAQEKKNAAQRHYEEGKHFATEKDWNTAVKSLDEALAIWQANELFRSEREGFAKHRDYEVNLNRGDDLFEKEDFQQAHDCYLKAEGLIKTEEISDRLKAARARLFSQYYQDGVAFLDDEEFGKAIASFKQAAKYGETPDLSQRMTDAAYGAGFQKAVEAESAGDALSAVKLYQSALAIKKTPEAAAKIKSLQSALEAEAWKQLTVADEYPFLEQDFFLPALAHLCGQLKEHVKALGDTDLVRLTLKNGGDIDIKGLKVRVVLQGLSDEAVQTVDVPARQEIVVALSPAFHEELSTLSEGRPGAIRWTIEDGKGHVLFDNTKTVKIASRNDLLLSDNGKIFLVVFVTPNDPLIDEIVANCGEDAVGYQGGTARVQAQAKAVYNTIAKLNIHYSSRCNSYLNQGELQGQRIYFPRECVQTTNANCIDGAVLFASVFEKMDLKPYIIIVPYHAFVAVSLTGDGTPILLPIETTMVGNGNSFEQAVARGEEEYKQYATTGQVIHVSKARQLGLTPYPYYESLGKKDFSLRRRLNLRD